MVEIVFSNKKEKKDVAKVGLLFGKIDKKYHKNIWRYNTDIIHRLFAG